MYKEEYTDIHFDMRKQRLCSEKKEWNRSLLNSKQIILAYIREKTQ